MSNLLEKNAEGSKYWLEDYYNEWLALQIQLNLGKEGFVPKTFESYVKNKVYEGVSCNLSKISPLFLHQSDRLVRVCHTFLSEQEPDLKKCPG